MKGKYFEKHIEIWKALLDGKKITSVNWRKHEYVHIVDERLVNGKNDEGNGCFSEPNDYYIYEEPKRTFQFTEEETEKIFDDLSCFTCLYHYKNKHECKTDDSYVCKKGKDLWLLTKEVK